MVQPSLKCVLCLLNKTQTLLLNQDFLGRNLLSIITNLCNNEVKDNIKPTDNVCAECAMELWRSEKMLTQVKHTFARKKATTTTKVKTTTVGETANETDSYTFQCKSCNYNTTQLKLFKAHMLRQHGEAMSQPYACGQCEMGFSRLDFYNRHIEKQHAQQEEGNENKMIKFQIKMEEPTKKPKIENGTNTTTITKTTNDTTTNDGNEFVFKCTECKYSSVKPKVFRRHLMTVHKYDKNDCFRCDICGKAYAIANAFKNHMEKHRDLNLSLHKQTTMISEQTLNNAKATSTPVEKKKLAKVVNSTPKPEVAPVNVESTLKKKKKKRPVEVEVEPEIPVVSPKKQKKLFEKIKDDTASTTLMNSAVEGNFACNLCPKVASSEKKLQKHMLKKHAN